MAKCEKKTYEINFVSTQHALYHFAFGPCICYCLRAGMHLNGHDSFCKYDMYFSLLFLFNQSIKMFCKCHEKASNTLCMTDTKKWGKFRRTLEDFVVEIMSAGSMNNFLLCKWYEIDVILGAG